MATMTRYLANLVLDHIGARNNGVALGVDIWVGLSTTTPAADGTNVTEPSGNGYARSLLGSYGQAATLKMGAASAGASTNTAIIFFPKATGNWGECTYFLIYDDPTAGNLLAFGVLTASITPVSGDVPIVEVGALDLSLE